MKLKAKDLPAKPPSEAPRKNPIHDTLLPNKPEDDISWRSFLTDTKVTTRKTIRKHNQANPPEELETPFKSRL